MTDNTNKLSNSESFYKSIFYGVGGAISVIKVNKNNTFRYLGVNPAFETLVGRLSKDIEGKEPKDFLPLIGKEAVDETLNDFRACTNTKKSITNERRIVINGEERWFLRQLDPVCDENGCVVRLIALIHDATKYKRTEEELRLTEDRYQKIVETQIEFIVRYLPNGIITFVNESCCRYFAKPHHEFIGHNIFKLAPKLAVNNKGNLLKKRVKVLTPEKPFIEDDHQIHCGDGTIRWSRWIQQAVFNSKAEVSEFQSVGRDIDDQKKAEIALKKSEEQLRLQNESIEKKNIALQELLEQVEIEKKRIKDNVVANVEGVLLPLIEKLKTKNISRKYVSLLKLTIEDIASSYGRRITKTNLKLSPRETEIANMIKNNISSKEIASLLNISLETVEKHRANIRTKLGLVKENINLNSYLKAL